MNEDRPPKLERILQQTARKVSGSGLHPLELLERIEAACRAGVRDGVAPNVFDVGLHERDHRRLKRSLPGIAREAEGVLDAAERQAAWTRLGEHRVAFRVAAGAAEGAPTVSARFGDGRRSDVKPARGATTRIARHRGLSLLIDGASIPLTHTPFVIGRGPGNDLVIASLSVSRRHAVIESEGHTLRMKDLGSRNGIQVAGERRVEIDLVPGLPVVLGDVEIVFEREG